MKLKFYFMCLMLGMGWHGLSYAQSVVTDQVCFYEHGNYGGARSCYEGGVPSLGNKNDTFSSVAVPTGCQVTAYADTNYGGAYKVYTTNSPFMSDFNDVTSSFKFSCNTSSGDYPAIVDLYREDWVHITLRNKVSLPSGKTFYLYYQPHESRNRALTMWDMASMLNIPGGDAKKINNSTRSANMIALLGGQYKVSLPTETDYRELRSYAGGVPTQWQSDLQGGPEFWTATRDWNDHKTFNLSASEVNTRWDTDYRAIALVAERDTTNDNKVCFYENAWPRYDNAWGFAHTKPGREKCFGNGEHPWVGTYPDGSNANDTFSSLIMGKNCKSVTVYTDGYFGGRSKQWTAPIDTLSVVPYRLNASHFDDPYTNLDNQISSLKVDCP